MALRTDYKNDVLNTAINAERQFEEVTNPNGTKSYRDVTDYSQVGDNFDADLVNTQNAEINAKAPIESPNFTGNPTAPTKAQSVEDDSLATTAFVKAALTNAIDPNLRTSGKAADAQATGNKLNSIQESVPTVDTTLKTSGAAADAKVTGDSVRSILNALVSETTTEAQVASCYDAAGEFPIKQLVANIIPKQDLNGYDHPWIGGAGKNLLPNTLSSGSKNGITYTVNADGTITFNGTPSVGNFEIDLPIPKGLYGSTLWLTGCPTGGAAANTYRQIFLINGSNAGNEIGSGVQREISATASTAVVRINVFNGYTAKNLVFKPMLSVEKDAYEPYENICPISGYSSLTVKRTGKNLLPNKGVSRTINGITFTVNADGTVTANGTNTENSTTSFFLQGTSMTVGTFDLPVGQYKLTGCPSGGNAQTYFMSLYYRNGSGNNFSRFDFGDGQTYTLTDETNIGIGVRIGIAKGMTVDNLTFKPMLRLASDTDETFEAYTGATYPVTFPTEAGTVYGGALTVNSDGSGMLTVDTAKRTVTSFSGNAEQNGFRTSLVLSGVTAAYGNLTCNMFKRASDYTEAVNKKPNSIGYNGNGQVLLNAYVNGAYITDISELNALIPSTGCEIVYPLANPTTYTLSAVEVVQMLQGVNNVWMDADGTLFFEYYANTVLYVKKITNAQKGMIAGVEESMTATKNYVIGDLVIVGDSLYKVTAAISSGVSLVIGTNITQTTVAEQLIALAKAK